MIIRITSPATIYIAVNELRSNPLPLDFMDTGFVMTVLKVSK
jgi:hypothetical protein